jgi:hypothetical protein
VQAITREISRLVAKYHYNLDGGAVINGEAAKAPIIGLDAISKSSPWRSEADM